VREPRPRTPAPGGGRGELEIVVKTTNRCNAACSYCSAGVGGGGPGRSLSPELARRICAEAAALVDAGEYRRVNVLWHGGEPLTLGKGFFRALLPHARRDVLSHSIQTNLLALDGEWLDVLEPLVGKDGIGTSCDPFSGERRFAGGDYLSTWLDGMSLLRERGWRVGCVYVLHRGGLDRAREVYWFFRNLGANGSVSLAVNPLLAVGDARRGGDALLLREGDLGGFLARLARVWAQDAFRLRVRPLTEWMAWLGGETPALPCNLAGDAGCRRARCGVTAGGEVFGCGRAADAGAAALGSLRDASLGEVLAVRARSGSGRDAVLLGDECGRCRFWPVCHGGCPHEGLFAPDAPPARTASCRDVRATLESLEALRSQVRAASAARVARKPVSVAGLPDHALAAMADFVDTGAPDHTLPRVLGRSPPAGGPRGRCLPCPAYKFCRGTLAGDPDGACDAVARGYEDRLPAFAAGPRA
jgi:uncharacterized protein